ncbi:MAG TPA: hypothetical protein VGM01_09560 [Ktedonobacteraceae bacterium]
MCISCGCGDVDNTHGDCRNITLRALDQAAQAAGTTREHVIQNIAQRGQAEKQPFAPSAQPKSGDYYQSEPLTKESGRHPGEVSPELGQDSGSDWQESQQMGWTGRGGVQNPQTNP